MRISVKYVKATFILTSHFLLHISNVYFLFFPFQFTKNLCNVMATNLKFVLLDSYKRFVDGSDLIEYQWKSFWKVSCIFAVIAIYLNCTSHTNFAFAFNKFAKLLLSSTEIHYVLRPFRKFICRCSEICDHLCNHPLCTCHDCFASIYCYWVCTAHANYSVFNFYTQ